MSETGGRARNANSRHGFVLEEATIDDIQRAILRNKLTVTDVVEGYLAWIKQYNGTCVNQPDGILGPITTIPHAPKINALITLNLRPQAREAWGFDERKARSMTDAGDADANMPDALQTAAAMDARFAKAHKLEGPLHGVVMAIKDQYDTFDMRTTSGADAFWANDRPPDDATFVVARLRAAGAIILAKANMGEYAVGGVTGQRSSFGGTMCNPYDTERDLGSSSGGSGIGPICRTVRDTAAILDAYAGFDPADELTAFSVGRKPPKPYAEYGANTRLDGYRIGVVREYMDKSLFTIADEESIDIVDRAIDRLRALGATIVDPGAHGQLFQDCVDKVVPRWQTQQFINQFPAVFPKDAAGQPVGDHIATLLNMHFHPSLVPHTAAGRPSIRNLGGTGGTDTGDGRYNYNAYIQERGDAAIKSLTDLIEKANFWNDPVQTRFTLLTVVFQCFAQQDLDAVVYRTGNIPPAIMTAPEEPTVNDRSPGLWTYINSRGFPAMTVPAGFTTKVYDRGPDRELLPAKAAALPVGIDFLGLPFSEAKLFAIGSAYEAATRHRTPPPDFGPLAPGG